MDMATRPALQIDCIDTGDGPPVVLVHSSASGNRQWHKLTARLSVRHRVLAPQLRGYGGTSAWPAGRRQTLDDAAAVVLAACEPLTGPIRIAGHSFGGTLALWAARALGERVSQLALYEPMLPGLLARHGSAAAAAEVAALYADVQRHGRAADWLALGERFTDYFNGAGAWAASPPQRRAAIAAALPPNVHEWDAAMDELPPDAFDGVRARCLLLCGTRSPLALREMSALLAQRHRRWRFEQAAGCGHMGPVTDAERINQHLVDFFDECGGA